MTVRTRCDAWGGARLAPDSFQDPWVCSVLRHGWIRAWAHASDLRYVQVMADRLAYPSDLLDARWEFIELVLSA